MAAMVGANVDCDENTSPVWGVTPSVRFVYIEVTGSSAVSRIHP